MSRRRAVQEETAEPTTLDDLPVAAQVCRAYRYHPWPRPEVRGHRKFIRFEVTEKSGGRVIAGVLHLTCTGGCGRIRKEPRRRNHRGRMVREFGKALSYGQVPGTRFLLKPPPGETEIKVDPDEVQDRLMHRLCPDLEW